MISDSTILKGVLFVIGLVGLILTFYLWVLVLDKIHATDFMWFLFAFMAFFVFIVACFRSVLDDHKIKDLQKRVKTLEEKNE